MTGDPAWRLALTPVADHRRVGVEHELTVRDDGRPVDFRGVLPVLTRDIRSLDPGDPRARRLPSGLAITADGWEAELVTPPVVAGSSDQPGLADLLARGRAELLDELHAHLRRPSVAGFSTHLNVSVPDAEVVRVGWEFARRCAPAVMALTERDDSPGMLVRPRRGRLEIGCEYVDGDGLLRALDLTVRCVTGLARGDLPPVVVDEPVAAREKFGWFVARGPTTDLDDWAGRHAVRAAPDRPRPLPHAGPRRVDGIEAETCWLTWNHVVWSLTDPERGRTAYAVLHTEQEAEFLAALDDGRLTGQVRRAMARRRPRRRLLRHSEVEPAALWDELRPAALVPAERAEDGSVPEVSRRSVARRLSMRRQPRTTAPAAATPASSSIT